MNTPLNAPVLVVDDEEDLRDLIEMTLLKMGLEVDTADGVIAAKKKLDSQPYALVLTDMRMPDGSGLEVVEYLQEKNLDIPIAIITAYGNADQAVMALKAGAFDYIQKPVTLAQLRSLVKSALKVHEVSTAAPVAVDTTAAEPLQAASAGDTASPTPSTPVLPQFPRLRGESHLLGEVKRMIAKLAKGMVPVHITGESGTGKEQAARSIHDLSPRKDGPFIAVNCGAIPENLMESEFFGYKKGSFTGADSDREGFFQSANGGTIFLDEVADLPLTMQVKLLRAIQERAVRRIGESKETPVDIRIVSATHKDLGREVEEGRFRQDLYYRLNVVSITMPALRELRDDLPMLIDHLLANNPMGEDLVLSDAAKKQLLHYSYPGNFRELENILERATALAADGVIAPDDLQIHTHELIQDDEEDGDSAVEVGDVSPLAHHFNMGQATLQEYLDEVERSILEQALAATKYNRTQAAKLLGISFRSMRYRLDRLEIN
ncbi:MAG: sigma-54-dependent Fis family transcriptional regulator [Vitreoscilla sp.]|nr:sigma-54-dependent Fis family transcriptional regulator [Vitreoscilla sp.]